MRLFENWIDGFYEYTSALPSPEIFRKWAGIALIAGALERRVWVDIGFGRPLYPNMYTVLVSPPGVGKTVLTSIVWDFWNDLSKQDDPKSGMHVASSSVTAAALVDELRAAERRHFISGLDTVEYNSLAVSSNELGVLLPAWENDMMNKLTDLYDGHPYSERRRTKELNFKIHSPQINMLVATQPGYLTNLLPEGAWDMGFMSRTVLIFSGEQRIHQLFQTSKNNASLKKNLAIDLKEIFKMYGEFSFEEDAKAALIEWHNAGGPPRPDHPRLSNYNMRRTPHLVKLMMVASVSSGDDRIINLEHYVQALDWLLEAEAFMPDIFKSMAVNLDAKTMEECWHFAASLYVKEQKPIMEHRIVNFLSSRLPAHSVMRVLEVMQAANLLQKKVTAAGDAYQPLSRNLR